LVEIGSQKALTVAALERDCGIAKKSAATKTQQITQLLKVQDNKVFKVHLQY
jgi:hypothetical protein